MKEIQEGKFLNKDLEIKTAAIQDEFDKIMHEMMSNRQGRDNDAFYEVMREFYDNNGESKHLSPTQRLISLKNTTADHKVVMAKNIKKGEYSITYCSEPGKSYIIEPHGGELNYNLA